jgi:hypothetical protein
MKNTFNTKINDLILEIESFDFSPDATKTKSLFDKINLLLSNNNYSILDINDFGTTIDSVAKKLSYLDHKWGMDASSDREDFITQEIRDLIEKLYFSKDSLFSLISELDIKKSFISDLTKILKK